MRSSDYTPHQDQFDNYEQASIMESEPVEPLWDERRSRRQLVEQPPVAGRKQLKSSTLVSALRSRSVDQRTPEPTQRYVAERPAESTDFLQSTKFNQCLRELEAEANEINKLSKQQEEAIERFKRRRERLTSICLASGVSPDSVDQFCELKNAAVTRVHQDDAGKFFLVTEGVDLFSDIQEAKQNAQYIRGFHKPERPQRRRPVARRAFHEESFQDLQGIWSKLTFTLEDKFHLTPLDVVTWFGGGFIGRIALQLILAAVPGLWPWIVGATIAAVAIALYTLFFTSRQDVSLIARLFLALIGLVVGGQIQVF